MEHTCKGVKGTWKGTERYRYIFEEMDMKLALSKFLAREIAKRARVWPGLAFGTSS